MLYRFELEVLELNQETIDRVAQAVAEWQYYQELPEEIAGWRLDKTVNITKDSYDIYSYINDELHKRVTVYYHDETREYKLREKLGVIEFCNISFIEENLAVFEQHLREDFGELLQDLTKFNPKSLNNIMRRQNITACEWAERLPAEILGFELFVNPTEPVKINNGSYIVIDYVNFALESSFTIYYNIFRDEFFGEARIWNIPDVNYDFDSVSLDELAAKLHEYMQPRLEFIYREAMKDPRAAQAKE